MLYLIGLGLNIDGISKYGLDVAKRCKKVYLENYTVDFPYSESELQELIGKKVFEADREFVESLEIVDEAKKTDIALLIYGAPLSATTHIALIQEAKNSGVRCKIIHSASVFDAVAETGLQLYKFGKTVSIPKHEAESFLDVIKENQTIGAHSLLLVDIGLDFHKALDRLKEIQKIIVCSRLGNKGSKIFYGNLKDLKKLKDVQKPYCFIVPGKLHFVEEEMLKESNQISKG